MKLRKILARSVAIASCVAMLSTSVFAASELTIATSEDNGKLKVTISGSVNGEVTFLALDEGTTLSDSTSPDKIQYIAQETKSAATDKVITFAQRAGGANKVDLYAGGQNVSEVATTPTSVYVKAVAELVTTAYESESTLIPTDDDGWKAFLMEKGLTVNYAGIGDTAEAPVALAVANADDFTIAAGAVENNVYPVAVAYKGTQAGTVNVTSIVPASPIVSVAATGIPSEAIDYYINEGEEFTVAIAEAEIADIAGLTVTATHEDTSTSNIDLDDLTYTVSGSGASTVVTLTYGEFPVGTVPFNVITKAITGVTVENAVPATYQMDVVIGTPVNEAYVEDEIADVVARFSAKYTWNDTTTTDVPAGDITYSVVKVDDDSYTVTISVAKADFATPVTIDVTIVEVESVATVIKGSVTASDTTGQVEDFSGAVPVGAVITAIKHDENAMGNYTGTAERFDAVSTVVDSRGNFELEVEPGVYTVIISHTKYSIYGGEFFVARTILDSNTKKEVTVVESTPVDLGNIELKYTYFGDLNLDGTLNTIDFRTFTQGFGSSIR